MFKFLKRKLKKFEDKLEDELQAELEKGIETIEPEKKVEAPAPSGMIPTANGEELMFAKKK